ncbi:hypothetical protein AMK28_28285 [Streptomyces sp. CB02115]|nr:hypothetical protein AMK28_28285 [Streptomyces sp. CB02115]
MRSIEISRAVSEKAPVSDLDTGKGRLITGRCLHVHHRFLRIDEDPAQSREAVPKLTQRLGVAPERGTEFHHTRQFWNASDVGSGIRPAQEKAFEDGELCDFLPVLVGECRREIVEVQGRKVLPVGEPPQSGPGRSRTAEIQVCEAGLER